MKAKIIVIFLLVFSGLSAQQKLYVILSTNYGEIKLKLYDDTPNHRRNFLKLVNEKYFDGTLFYRVVKDFVIQGGSSDSRNAPPGKHIGYGNPKMVIDSETKKSNFHKKGALCAPRQPEDINHFKMSDVSQFYIVQGRVYTHEELDLIEKATNNPIKLALKKQYYVPFKEELQKLKTENPREFNRRLREIKDKIAFDYTISDKLEFTEEQRNAYTTIGGLPDLDGDYTVFGEVVSGMNVLDKIAGLPTDKNNRPLTDVKIKARVVLN